MIWKEKQDMKLTDVYKVPTEGNFCDERWWAHKTAVVEDYSPQMD